MSATINAGTVEALLRLRDELTPVMARVSAGLMQSGAMATKAGVAMSTGLSLPLAAIGATALKMSTDFNKGMANISTLIPGNTARLLELKGAVQNTAVAMGKSTEDMSEGLYDLISTLGDSKDSVKLLEINAKAAAAGLATTQQAIGLTTAVTKTYGDTSAEATQKVADMAFQAVNIGKTTFPELAASIGAVTPLAQSAGVKLEEMFGVLATATGVTGNTSEVVNQMRASLTALMNPTEDMTQLLASMGRTGAQAGADLISEKGFVGALAAVREKAAALDIPLGKVLGRVEAQVLTLSLAGSQAQNYAKNLALMGTAAGSTDIAFQAQTQGINKAGFAWEQAKVKMQVAAQQLGDHLLPVVLRVGQSIQPLFEGALKLVDAFGKLPQPIQTGAIAFVALVAAIGPLLVGAGSLMMLSGALAPLVAPGVGKLALLATGVKSAGVAAAASAPLIGLFTAALAGIVVPFAFVKVVELFEQLRGYMKDAEGWRRDAMGVADVLKNQVAVASGIAGREVTKTADAHQVLSKRIGELRQNWGPANGEMQISAAGMASLAAQIGGTAVAVQKAVDPLAALREEAKRLHQSAITPLTAAQREIALAFASAGIEAGKIAEKLHVTKGAVDAVLASHQKGTDAARAYADSIGGEAAKRSANDLLAWLKRVPDLTKLTAAGQLEIATTMEAAIDVYRSAGLVAPDAMERVAASMRALTGTVSDETAKQRQMLQDTLDAWSQIRVAATSGFKGVSGIDPAKLYDPGDFFGSVKVRNDFSGPVGLDPSTINMGNWDKKGPGKMGSIFGSPAEFGQQLSSTILGAVQGGGNPVSAAAGMVGSKVGTNIAASLTKVGGPLFNTALGGVFSAALPVVGSLIGPLADVLWKKLFGTEGRDLVKDFAAKFGGFDALRVQLNALGAEGERLWVSLTQGVGRNNPAQAKSAIEAINAALSAQASRVADVQAAEERKASAVEAAEKKAAAAVDAVKAKIKSLDDELAALNASEAPEAVMGIVETQTRARLAAQRAALEEELRATTEQGEAAVQTLKDAALESFGLMTQAVDRLTNALLGIPQQVNFTVTGTYTKNGSAGAEDPGVGFAGGTHGKYLDFGMGTQVTLHGRERVMTEAEGRAGGGGGRPPIVVQLVTTGRILAEVVVPEIPEILDEYGLTR